MKFGVYACGNLRLHLLIRPYPDEQYPIPAFITIHWARQSIQGLKYSTIPRCAFKTMYAPEHSTATVLQIEGR